MKLLLIIFFVALLSSTGFYPSSYGEKIPTWIKDIFVWYSQDLVSEDELLNAIKFLVENKIIILNSENTDIWKPLPGTSWNWDLEDTIDSISDVEMYDIDLFENTSEQVEFLHSENIKAVCYISVGSWEDWRPDADKFPPEILGNDYDGWPGEKWVDIRNLNVLGPIIENRFDLCQEKGFDGIEPDNIDAYSIDSGFDLTYEDQIKFNIWLSEEAHKRGLSIGLKNDLDQIDELLPYFDWALSEDCFAYQECEKLVPFIQNNKAVFQAEYTDLVSNMGSLCQESNELGFSAILKDRDLTAEFQSC